MSTNKRSIGYIVALLLMSVGFPLLVTGFASPFWLYVSGSGYTGLWQYCVVHDGASRCAYLDVSLTYSEATAWFHATRVLESFAVIIYCATVLQLLVANCSNYNNPRSKRPSEVLSAFAGVLGLVGAIVYGSKIGDHRQTKYLSWSFALTIVGSCLAIIGSCVMMFTEDRSESRIAGCGIVVQTNVAMQGVAQYPVGAYGQHPVGAYAQYPVETNFNPNHGIPPQYNVFDPQYVVNTSDVVPLYAKATGSSKSSE